MNSARASSKTTERYKTMLETFTSPLHTHTQTHLHIAHTHRKRHNFTHTAIPHVKRT